MSYQCSKKISAIYIYKQQSSEVHTHVWVDFESARNFIYSNVLILCILLFMHSKWQNLACRSGSQLIYMRYTYIVVFLPKNINNLYDFISNKYTKHIESIDKTTWTYVCRYYHNSTITSHTDITFFAHYMNFYSLITALRALGLTG